MNIYKISAIGYKDELVEAETEAAAIEKLLGVTLATAVKTPGFKIVLIDTEADEASPKKEESHGR